MQKISSEKARIIGALVLVQILFGVNYVVSKVIVDTFPPLVWASFRVIVSAVVLFGLSLAAQRKRPQITLAFLGPLAIYACLGVIINQASFLTGLHYTSSTNSAILNTLIPIFTLVFVTLTGVEPLTRKRAFGFFFALAGVLVIRKIENFTLSDQTFIGDALTVLNCLSYGLFLTMSKKFVSRHDPMWTTTGLFMVGSVGLTLLALPDWLHFQWPVMSPSLLGCMTFSILGSTLLAYLLNLWALARAESSSVALSIYLQPVVASLLAWAWFGEIITLRTLLASLLIFAGILIAISKRKAIQ